MDNIVQRLGLVIHWAGFLVTALFLVYTLIFSLEHSAGDGLLSYLESYFDQFLFDHIFNDEFFPQQISFLIGWCIRFILVGKVHILPWKW